MKTLTILTLTTALIIAVSAPAQANSITDTISENISDQLTELSTNIKQQANAALQKTMTELFFRSGAEQAAHTVSATEDSTEPQPEKTSKE